jgi:hypothetical protein
MGLIENCVVAGCCEGGNEPLGAVKGRKCVDWPSNTSGGPLNGVGCECFASRQIYVHLDSQFGIRHHTAENRNVQFS